MPGSVHMYGEPVRAVGTNSSNRSNNMSETVGHWWVLVGWCQHQCPHLMYRPAFHPSQKTSIHVVVGTHSNHVNVKDLTSLLSLPSPANAR